MEEGENKRKVKKASQSKKMNIKLSTEDKDTSRSELKLNLNNKSQEGKKNLNLNSNRTSLQIDGKNTIENRISKLIIKNEELNKQLEKLKYDRESNSEEQNNEISSLNAQISQLEKEEALLYKINKNIIGKMLKLEKRVSIQFEGKFKMSKLLNMTKDVKKLNEDDEIRMENLRKDILLKNIEYNKKGKEKIEKI